MRARASTIASTARQGAQRRTAVDAMMMAFAEWCRAHGFLILPACEVLEAYELFCDEEACTALPDDTLLECFARLPGVSRNRRRLSGTRDKELNRIRRRLGHDRAVIYFIDSHEEVRSAGAPDLRRAA